MILTLQSSENIMGLMKLNMADKVNMNEFLNFAFKNSKFKTSGYNANVKYV